MKPNMINAYDPQIDKFARNSDADPALVAAMARWMRNNAHDYQERSTGEVNYTALAEGAAEEFNAYEDDADYVILDWVFDLAVIVGG